MADPRGSPLLRPLVVGLGTDERGDDALGLEAVRALRAGARVDADLVEGPHDLTGLLEVWKGRRQVVLIDAVRSGSPPGTLHRWDAARGPPLPRGSEVSSHGLTLAHVVELAQSLGELPEELLIFGIEANDLAPGVGLSAEVKAAMPTLCTEVREQVSRSLVLPPDRRMVAPHA